MGGWLLCLAALTRGCAFHVPPGAPSDPGNIELPGCCHVDLHKVLSVGNVSYTLSASLGPVLELEYWEDINGGFPFTDRTEAKCPAVDDSNARSFWVFAGRCCKIMAPLPNAAAPKPKKQQPKTQQPKKQLQQHKGAAVPKHKQQHKQQHKTAAPKPKKQQHHTATTTTSTKQQQQKKKKKKNVKK